MIALRIIKILTKLIYLQTLIATLLNLKFYTNSLHFLFELTYFNQISLEIKARTNINYLTYYYETFVKLNDYCFTSTNNTI